MITGFSVRQVHLGANLLGKVHIGGKIVDPEDAKVSVLDRGFLYGDSVYEVLRVYSGAPFAFEAHLDRLGGAQRRLSAISMPAG